MIKVYTARKILTMNPSWPTGTAIAVEADRIVEVGSLATMQPWLDAHPHEIDRQFADAFLLHKGQSRRELSRREGGVAGAARCWLLSLRLQGRVVYGS